MQGIVPTRNMGIPRAQSRRSKATPLQTSRAPQWKSPCPLRILADPPKPSTTRAGPPAATLIIIIQQGRVSRARKSPYFPLRNDRSVPEPGTPRTWHVPAKPLRFPRFLSGPCQKNPYETPTNQQTGKGKLETLMRPLRQPPASHGQLKWKVWILPQDQGNTHERQQTP